jgi:hypothetical protein
MMANYDGKLRGRQGGPGCKYEDDKKKYYDTTVCHECCDDSADEASRKWKGWKYTWEREKARGKLPVQIFNQHHWNLKDRTSCTARTWSSISRVSWGTKGKGSPKENFKKFKSAMFSTVLMCANCHSRCHPKKKDHLQNYGVTDLVRLVVKYQRYVQVVKFTMRKPVALVMMDQFSKGQWGKEFVIESIEMEDVSMGAFVRLVKFHQKLLFFQRFFTSRKF